MVSKNYLGIKMYSDKEIPPYLVGFVKEGKTTAEKFLAHHLKKEGIPFQDNKIIVCYNNYLTEVDFKIGRLLVEVDGSIHKRKDIKIKDKAKRQILEDLGYEVIHFRNDIVFKSVHNVLNEIKRRMQFPQKSIAGTYRS